MTDSRSESVSGSDSNGDGSEQRIKRLVSAFSARNVDGTPRFPRKELLAFLPVLLQSVEGPLPPALGPLIEESAGVLGVTKGMSPEDVKKQIDVYYAYNPHIAELFRELLKEMGLAGIDTAAAAARLKL